jgi:hypothetical protein
MQLNSIFFYYLFIFFYYTLALVNQNKPKLVSMTTKKDNRGGPRPNSGVLQRFKKSS